MADPPPTLGDATRLGLRRAGFHLLKAGYEVLTGVGAFLEEVGKTRGPAPQDEPTRVPVEGEAPAPPQRIPVEDDD